MVGPELKIVDMVFVKPTAVRIAAFVIDVEDVADFQIVEDQARAVFRGRDNLVVGLDDLGFGNAVVAAQSKIDFL